MAIMHCVSDRCINILYWELELNCQQWQRQQQKPEHEEVVVVVEYEQECPLAGWQDECQQHSVTQALYTPGQTHTCECQWRSVTQALYTP